MSAVLKYCRVEWRTWGAVVQFADGVEVSAWPHDTHHYRVIAHRCGYGDDILGYCREHELAHALAEEWFHDRPSRVLHAQGQGERLTGHESAYEEAMAQTVQRLARANEWPIIGGVNWRALRGRFEQLSRDALDGFIETPDPREPWLYGVEL